MNQFIVNLEDKFFSWINKYRYQVVTFVFLTLVLVFISNFPYINLHYTPELLFLSVVVLFLIVFISSEISIIFLFGLSLLFIAIVLLLMEEVVYAEAVGDLIYFVLGLGVFLYLGEL